MSRSGYSDDCENWSLIRWRGAVASAIRGKRGQAFLKEMLTVMDALPERKLISDKLEMDGAVCAIGAVGKARGLDMSKIDPDDRETVAYKFAISPALAAEIVYVNDDHDVCETPEARFARVRRWIEAQIRPDNPPAQNHEAKP
jgi:hypothetical protein